MSTTCPNCHAQVVPGASFCDNCGARLPAEQAPSVPGICPHCSAAVGLDDLFCDQCGHDLLVAPGFPLSPQRPAEPQDNSAANLSGNDTPRLLIQPAGTLLTHLSGKDDFVIGREDPASGSYPDVDLVPYGGEEGGVSRRHAQISRRGEAFFIEDLNSVNYTFVNKRKIAVGVAHPLRDGDEIRLGRVLMRFETH